MKAQEDDALIFVVESCQNCREHHWNTRHDESKYEEFYNKISNGIIEKLPSAVVMRNQIPKSYLPYDLYCNLIPNEDDNCEYYDQVPRTGAFEVSYKGLLVFSKLQQGYWPNIELVANKCANLVSDERENKDLSRWLAGSSPTKSGEVKRSAAKQRDNRKSPVKTSDAPSLSATEGKK